MKNIIFENYLNNLKKTINLLDIENLENISKIFLNAYEKERSFYIFGNGGSAANASHIAGDFVKGVSYGLDKRFKFICLNDNLPALMAIANDINYEDIFVEQLKNFLKKDDIVIGLSGSGNSKNVIRALEYANKKEAITIAFCGYKGGKIKKIAKYNVHAKINDMEISEDIHLISFHIIKQYLIKKIKGNNLGMGSAYDKRVK